LLELRADCRVRVLDPIDPAQFGGDVERFRDHTRALIIAEKQRMLEPLA
jgi:1-acyl-sn-glycerol-3-phosphate acyltransferase